MSKVNWHVAYTMASLLILGISTANLAIGESNNVVSIAAADVAPEFAQSERLATELVGAHLPQLKPVLASLKKHSSKEYQRAVSDLARSARRLAVARKKGDAVFEIELKLLQSQTQVDLAKAELLLNDTRRGREHLQKLLVKSGQIRMEYLQYQRDRLASRIAKMQAQLQRYDDQIASSSEIENAAKVFANTVRQIEQRQASDVTSHRSKSKSMEKRKNE